MSRHTTEGPPCQHMENLLQQAADGSLRGLRKWYAVMHASRCFRCGNFLTRLTRTIRAAQAAKEPVGQESMARLRALLGGKKE